MLRVSMAFMQQSEMYIAIAVNLYTYIGCVQTITAEIVFLLC